MQLTEVQLRNWRSYRNATFSFPALNGSPEANKKRVILVGAQNGVGKTSLLIALYLGLFGREAMHLIEGIRVSSTKADQSLTYRNLLERTIHRPALRGDDPYAMVRLRFLSPGGARISIRRKWGFRRGGKVRDLATADGEEVIIDVDGESTRFENWQEANDQIGELLFPPSVMPCFFFDGEQAQERVEAAGGRALLDAVKTLYGTGLLDRLRESLDSFVSNERAALRREFGNIKGDELNEKRDELRAIREKLNDVENNLTIKRREAEALEADRQRFTNELYQLVGDRHADISQYAETIKALQAEQSDLRQQLTAGLASLALPMALARTGPNISTQLDAERIRDEWGHLKQAALSKAHKIVQAVLPESGIEGIEPPLVDSQVVELRSRLENALEALYSPPPDGCAEEYRFVFLREADRTAVATKINRLMQTGPADIQKIALEWSRISSQLSEAQRRFDAIRDVEPKLVELKQSINNVNDKLSGVNAEINGLETREKSYIANIKDLRAAIGQMERRQIMADPVQQKLNVAYQVVEVLDEAGERLVPLCKESLEQRCTFHFSNMVSDEYRKFSVRFDADTEPRLEHENHVVYVAGLSGAQKRAFGLAFTLAVADVSGQQAPIVIDTPVGNMDSRYRHRVLEYVAEAAPGQVFFLSHDEEISPEYRAGLEPYIMKTMLLNFEPIEEGSGITTVIDDAYFEGASI